MKKGFCISLGLIICQAVLAAIPTAEYTTQPVGTINPLPGSFVIHNLAPVPQDICSPTLTAGGESATCTGLPVCQDAQVQTASFSCSVTTTCDSKLPATGNCSLSMNATVPSTLPSSTTFTFRLSYGSYQTFLTSNAFTINGANPPPPAGSYRTITFTNSCNQDVWFGSITGAAPSKNILTGGSIDCTGGSGDAGKQACVAAGGACYPRIGAADACYSQSCSSDSDCMTGASCFSTTSKCYWQNPIPADQSFHLTNGTSNTIKIPQYDTNGIGVVWSGAFGGRTGCTSGGCISGLCTTGSDNAQGVCSLGTGFQQPATQPEATFLTFPVGVVASAVSDAYDVTVINGANLPMAMYPTNTALIPTTGNPYTCGAGAYNEDIPASAPVGVTIGASTWAFNTNANSSLGSASVAYRYVTNVTSTPCSDDSDCSSGTYCGLSYPSIGSTVAPGTGQLYCGTFAGWFSADQICGTNNNFTKAYGQDGTTEVTDFQCNTPVASGPSGTMTNLYLCNENYGESCYTSTAVDTCCGCADWHADASILVPYTDYVHDCYAKNDNWTGLFNSANQPQVFDTLLFMKQSCPSCYVYPFDDQSSSFTCTNGTTTTNNTIDYTIEFCPGGAGNTGFQP